MIKLMEIFALNELVKTDLTTDSGKQKYIFIYKRDLFLLDDESDITNVKKSISDHPGLYRSALEEKNVYEFLQMCAESAADVFIGQFYSPDTVFVWTTSAELSPQTSLNVKKAVKQLGIKKISYQHYDIDSNDTIEKEIPNKKLVGGIPNKFYHGTSTNDLKDILQFGLYPGRGAGKWMKNEVENYDHVFLAATFDIAMFYARNAVGVQNDEYNYPIVLEFESIPDRDLLVPDYDADISTTEEPYYTARSIEPKSKSTMKNMGLSRETGKWGYKGRIPAHFIKWVYYYNRYKNKWHRSSPRVWKQLLSKNDMDWERIGNKLGLIKYD